MKSEADLDQRLGAIEAELQQLRTAVSALLHARVTESAESDETTGYSVTSISSWIEGEIRSAIGDEAVQDAPETEVVGHAMGYDSQHYPQCSTRVRCLTSNTWGCCR